MSFPSDDRDYDNAPEYESEFRINRDYNNDPAWHGMVEGLIEDAKKESAAYIPSTRLERSGSAQSVQFIPRKKKKWWQFWK